MAMETFARDLGYLDQFFDKLDAHAATLSPAAGARLRALMAEERARWTEIRAIMGGAAPSAAPAPPAPTAPAAPRRGTDTRLPLTVGSLIERPR